MTAVILIAAGACIALLVVWACLDPPPREPRNPPPGAGEVRADERPSPDLDALTPGPVGTGWLEALPDDDPADTTGIQSPATRYLGKPSGEYVDDLFAKHAGAES